VPFDTRNSCIATCKLASRNFKIVYLIENRRLCVLTSNSVRMVDTHFTCHKNRLVSTEMPASPWLEWGDWQPLGPCRPCLATSLSPVPFQRPFHPQVPLVPLSAVTLAVSCLYTLVAPSIPDPNASCASLSLLCSISGTRGPRHDFPRPGSYHIRWANSTSHPMRSSRVLIA
jgi:hypothetical protein